MVELALLVNYLHKQTSQNPFEDQFSELNYCGHGDGNIDTRPSNTEVAANSFENGSDDHDGIGDESDVSFLDLVPVKDNYVLDKIMEEYQQHLEFEDNVYVQSDSPFSVRLIPV